MVMKRAVVIVTAKKEYIKLTIDKFVRSSISIITLELLSIWISLTNHPHSSKVLVFLNLHLDPYHVWPE